ncbi:MAG: hypothetical protein U9R28_04965 [Pseudomonadota bacterium]|nr:hypothetical protein [Pseudomonadota bacterium]
MPHIVIEVSQDSLQSLLPQQLVSVAFDSVKQTGLFNSENIKVRLHPVEFYQLGLEGSGFIHVMCRIHAGKTQSQKQQLTQALINAIAESLNKRWVITAEVVEMDRASYAKKVLGS